MPLADNQGTRHKALTLLTLTTINDSRLSIIWAMCSDCLQYHRMHEFRDGRLILVCQNQILRFCSFNSNIISKY